MIYDVIVIGLGAMGSASLYQLAKREINVLGIDRFSPPHEFGSTHGETRVTRQAIGEGAEYVPLALRSYELFRQIEAETNSKILTVMGGLIMSYPNTKANLHSNDFIGQTVSTARQFGIKHRTLTANEISREFPQFNLTGNEIGYYEDEMGFLSPENGVKSQLELAEKYGAKISRHEQVLAIKPFNSYVEVLTNKNTYQAEKIIMSVGSWINNFIEITKRDFFKIYRQVFYWFDVEDSYEDFKLGSFPTFIWDFGRWENDFVYGFPAINGKTGGLKIATETYYETTDPDNVERDVSSKEIDEVFSTYIENKIRGISPKSVKTATCLYTTAPNSRFVIDKSPENDRIIIASPCSGHGFKHSAAIGECLAELAITGKSTIDISAFSLNKFQ
jgi:sarcosine oxidase